MHSHLPRICVKEIQEFDLVRYRSRGLGYLQIGRLLQRSTVACRLHVLRLRDRADEMREDRCRQLMMPQPVTPIVLSWLHDTYLAGSPDLTLPVITNVDSTSSQSNSTLSQSDSTPSQSSYSDPEASHPDTEELATSSGNVMPDEPAQIVELPTSAPEAIEEPSRRLCGSIHDNLN